MRYCLVLLILTVGSCSGIGQDDLLGAWYGRVEFTGGSLRINFHLDLSNGSWEGHLESPDQGSAKRSFSEIHLEDHRLFLAVQSMQWEFEGGYVPETNRLNGVIRQGGQLYPLELTREPILKQVYVRPQTPKAPFPYKSEEVVFKNGEISLAGTLTYPEQGNSFPAVVLISGSGPQDRDETIAEHKPFWVIADFLSRRGFAVLRYDDRGTGSSGGRFFGATSADFSLDAEAGLNFLKQHPSVNPARVGLMGHSEGGMIGAMVAARNEEVRFVISLAGTGLNGAEVLRIQTELIAVSGGMAPAAAKNHTEQNQKVFALALKHKDMNELTKVLRDFYHKEQPDMDPSLVDQMIKTISDPWLLYFLAYDPSEDWKRVKCPILAVNGSLDLQVTPAENLYAIAKAANEGENFEVTIEEFAGLNHLFQTTDTGNIDEYVKLEETFSPRVLERLTEWLTVHSR